MQDKLGKDIIIRCLPQFLDLHEISICMRVFRGIGDMYKMVKEATIYDGTDVRKLVEKCPNITSIIITRRLTDGNSYEKYLYKAARLNRASNYSTSYNGVDGDSDEDTHSDDSNSDDESKSKSKSKSKLQFQLKTKSKNSDTDDEENKDEEERPQDYYRRPKTKSRGKGITKYYNDDDYEDEDEILENNDNIIYYEGWTEKHISILFKKCSKKQMINTDNDDELLLLSKLPITKMKFTHGTPCLYNYRRFNLTHLEADLIYNHYGLEQLQVFKGSIAYNAAKRTIDSLKSTEIYSDGENYMLDEGYKLISGHFTIDDEFTLDHIAKCKTLQHVYIDGCSTRHDNLAALLELPSLTSLEVKGLKNRSYKELTNLRKLSLINCYSIKRIHLPYLETLYVYEGIVDVRNIKSMPITEMRLHNVRVHNPEELCDMPLRSLTLLGEIDEVYKVLHKLQLKTLYIDIIHQHDYVLKTKLPITLTTLTIKCDFSIFHDTVKYEFPPNVEELHIYGPCIITNQAVEAISRLPLRKLSLYNAHITNDMLKILSCLNLQYLNILDNDKITCEGLSYIRHMPLRKLLCNDMPTLLMLRM